MEVGSSVLEHPGEAEGFVVILKPIPRRPGESPLDDGHVDALGDRPPPSRPSFGRADVPAIQGQHEVIIHLRALYAKAANSTTIVR
jgi:hypothetical protein